MSSDSTPNHPIAADQQLMISELKNQLARYEQVLAAPIQGSDEGDFIDLRALWNMLLRRRWTVLITFAVVLLSNPSVGYGGLPNPDPTAHACWKT